MLSILEYIWLSLWLWHLCMGYTSYYMSVTYLKLDKHKAECPSKAADVRYLCLGLKSSLNDDGY